MAARTILWVDLRTIRSEPDLCSSLPPVYTTQRLRHLSNLLQAVTRWRPWALCFEYDVPDARSLAALLEVKARHATLPIVLLAEKHAKQLQTRAFRHCARDYLVKPVSIKRLCDCLTNIDTAPPLDLQTLAPAVSYVSTNYADKVRLSTAAELCDLSRFQFSRCFKKEQGLTFRDFVVQVRIQRAAELMRRSASVSVTEAAFVVGFNDLSHFSRMFRRQLGVSPSHYRRSEGEPIQLPLFPLPGPK